jgi:hypothetical protein
VSNGNGRLLTIVWRVTLATLTFAIFPALAYYVHAEAERGDVRVEEKVEAMCEVRYLPSQRFNDWRVWEYQKDMSMIKKSLVATTKILEEVHRDFEDHRTETE